MTFETEGFAGASSAALRADQRKRHNTLLAFADECAGVALQIAGLLTTAKNRGQLTVGAYFARCVTHYQAAIILAESGMTLESLSLSRGLLETVFVMLAVAENAVAPRELAGHDYASRVKHANTLLNAKDYPNVEQFKAQLNEFVEQDEGSMTIDMREFARRGKALGTYDGLYRHLSHHAAHPSLSAVDDYFEKRNDGSFGVRLKPLLDKTPAAILTATTGILLACFACEKVGLHTEEMRTVLQSTWDKCQMLDHKYGPWA